MRYFLCKKQNPEIMAPIPSTQHQNPESIPQPMRRPTPKAIKPTPRRKLYRHIKTPPAQLYAGGAVQLTISLYAGHQGFVEDGDAGLAAVPPSSMAAMNA